MQAPLECRGFRRVPGELTKTAQRIEEIVERVVAEQLDAQTGTPQVRDERRLGRYADDEIGMQAHDPLGIY